MSATGDLLNAVERERRILAREKPVADVELEATGRNRVMASSSNRLDAEGPEYRASVDELRAAAEKALEDPRERQVAELMFAGVSEVSAFANVLRIEHLPIEEQRDQVKRCKDRVTKRLQRLGARLA
jgi:hypothetical protein